MSRITDINELFAEIEEIITSLSSSYENAKSNSTTHQIPRAKVKGALEHLRSILEYCAQDVHMHVYGNNSGELYFPYAKNEALFNKHLTRSFKALRVRDPKIYDFMASVQPHVSGSNWLIDLCGYTNTNKHKYLTPQVKKTKNSVTVGNLIRVSGNSSATFVNSTVNGAQIGKDSLTPVTISDAMTNEEIVTQLNPGNPYISVTRVTEEVKFFIEGSTNDALSFIQDAKERISKFVSQLYSEIEK